MSEEILGLAKFTFTEVMSDSTTYATSLSAMVEKHAFYDFVATNNRGAVPQEERILELEASTPKEKEDKATQTDAKIDISSDITIVATRSVKRTAAAALVEEPWNGCCLMTGSDPAKNGVNETNYRIFKYRFPDQRDKDYDPRLDYADPNLRWDAYCMTFLPDAAKFGPCPYDPWVSALLRGAQAGTRCPCAAGVKLFRVPDRTTSSTSSGFKAIRTPQRQTSASSAVTSTITIARRANERSFSVGPASTRTPTMPSTHKVNTGTLSKRPRRWPPAADFLTLEVCQDEQDFALEDCF
jgi:hypothetical protein